MSVNNYTASTGTLTPLAGVPYETINALSTNIADDFDATKAYSVGEIVRYTDNLTYKCIVDTTAGTLPTNTTYWTRKSLGEAIADKHGATYDMAATTNKDAVNITEDGVVKSTLPLISQFIGTRAEWEALSAVNKAKYRMVNITDEVNPGDNALSDRVDAIEYTVGDSSSGLVKSVADIQDVIPSDASSSNKLITQAEQGGKKFIKQVAQLQGSSSNFYLEYDEIKDYNFIYIAMHAKDINNNSNNANNSYSQLIMIYIKPFIDNINSITAQTTNGYAGDMTNRISVLYAHQYNFNYILKRLYVYPNLFNYNVENIADVFGD